MWLSSSSRADTHTHTPIWHWCNDADMIGLLWWVRKKWVYPFTEHMWSEVEFGHKFTRASRITVESKLLFQIPLTPTLSVIRRRSFEWPSMHSNYPAELLHSSGISIKRQKETYLDYPGKFVSEFRFKCWCWGDSFDFSMSQTLIGNWGNFFAIVYQILTIWLNEYSWLIGNGGNDRQIFKNTPR